MRSNPTKSKVFPRLLLAVAIGAMLILILIIYNILFPEQYWDLRELEQHQAKWENQHITHYRMAVDLPWDSTYLGQLPMPVTVEVKDSKVVSAVDARGEKVLSMSEVFTVPGLFSYVHQYYLEKPPSVEVSYDPTFGFPESIYIVPYTEPCCEDFEIEVRDFQILP